MPRPSRVTGPVKSLRNEHWLVPAGLRERFSRVTVHFDFLIRDEHLAEFRDAWKQSAPLARDCWGPFSARSDACQGLTVYTPERTDARHVYHAVVEFRHGAVSPHPRVSDRKMRIFVGCMRRLAEEIEVRSWSQEARLETAMLTGRFPANKLFAENERPGPGGYRVRLTGLEAAFQKGDEPPLYINVTVRGDTATLTESGKGFEFPSLAALFDPKTPVLAFPERLEDGHYDKSQA